MAHVRPSLLERGYVYVWLSIKFHSSSARFSLLVLIDLLLVIPAFVIGLASSGVISGGLAATCDSYRDFLKSYNTPSPTPSLYGDDEDAP